MVSARTTDQLREDAEIASAVDEIKQFARQSGVNGDGVPIDISDPNTLVRVYVTATGEPRDVPVWTLEGRNSILRRRNGQGQRYFTMDVPDGTEWKQGEVMCFLHPDHPRRGEFDEMGLIGKFCMSAHLASVFSRRIHMQHRHAQEWATIQDYEQEKREETAREQQSVIARAALQQIEGGGRRGRMAE